MRDFPWRHLGDIPYETFVGNLDERNSPLLPHARLIYEYARPHTYLLDRQLFHESEYGTTGRLSKDDAPGRFMADEDTPIPKNAHNPLGLRPRGDRSYRKDQIVRLEGDKGMGFLVFAHWYECVAEWRSRITSQTYAYALAETVEQFIHLYAPSHDGNNEAAYVSKIYAPLNAWRALTEETFFDQKREFTTVPGAVGRACPNTDAIVVRRYAPNQIVRCRGFRLGQKVAGDARWLTVEGRAGIHIHASGVQEKF